MAFRVSSDYLPVIFRIPYIDFDDTALSVLYMPSMDHVVAMKRCLELAELGGRAVMPNPMVGCVIVRNDVIVAEGFHAYFGGPHAEVVAMQNLSGSVSLEDATLYVSLEPCAHFGKTPPCADAIVATGIKRVVVGCRDPFACVAGKGISKLRSHGVEVIEGVLREECIDCNRRFILAHRLSRPYVILKWATTADGYIARSDLTSKWISSEESRSVVHEWRSQEMAILVGTTTARVDNPKLTARIPHGVNPKRVVIDRRLTLPKTHAIFDSEASTLIYNELKTGFEESVEYTKVDLSGSLQPILSDLYSKGIISVLVEGGAKLLQSFIDQDQWDEVREFTSSATFGNGVLAPNFLGELRQASTISGDTLRTFRHSRLAQRLGCNP